MDAVIQHDHRFVGMAGEQGDEVGVDYVVSEEG